MFKRKPIEIRELYLFGFKLFEMKSYAVVKIEEREIIETPTSETIPEAINVKH